MSGEIIGITGIVVAVGIAILHRIAGVMDKCQKSRNEYAERLKYNKLKIRQIYKDYLGKALRRLNLWLGSPFSGKALIINTGLAEKKGSSLPLSLKSFRLLIS
jgi:hypothetical protein